MEKKNKAEKSRKGALVGVRWLGALNGVVESCLPGI